ncbi:MAG: hypothetical protein FD149_644 [Rhodospirillaceae bacterium]|nr:MAG: hypothetical protein FD149_644 [Rhodospirillaceae bacterium]
MGSVPLARILRGRWGAVVLVLVAGCVPAPPATVVGGPLPPVMPSPLKPYPNLDRFLQCVPFARVVSGIDLRGDAWTWWAQAASRYQRGAVPREGAVLVFKKSSRLKFGHVAVVAQVSGERELLLTHANWGHEEDTRGVVHERQPVRDVSPRNDWSLVQLKNRR